MLPSRGLRWSSQTIGIGRRRIENKSTRNFSSNRAIKANPFLSPKNAAFPTSRTAQLLRNGAGIRFASTGRNVIETASTAPATSTPTPTDAASSSAIPPVSSPESSFSTAFDNAVDFSTENLLDIPEQIGYLNSLGLDHGWGPTSVMQFVLEHIHIYAGTPWWASIILTAVAVRVVLIKPFFGAAENAARMATIAPLTKPIMEKAKAAQIAGDTTQVVELRQELSRINARAGVSMWKAAAPFLQAPIGIGTFIALKAMAALPIPGLETGGALWFYNLAIPDPFVLLPLATATVFHFVIKQGGETGVQQMNPTLLKGMMWGLPAITLLFTAWLPAAVQLSFLAGGILSGVQATIFRQTWFRQRFNMTPLPAKKSTTTASTTPSPYQSTIKRHVPRGPLSTSELGSRFEGPKAGVGKFQPPPKSTGVLGGIKNTYGSIKDASKGAVDEAQGWMETRTGTTQEKKTKKQREEYELKRREEIKQARLEEQEERRALREARKRMGDE